MTDDELERIRRAVNQGYANNDYAARALLAEVDRLRGRAIVEQAQEKPEQGEAMTRKKTAKASETTRTEPPTVEKILERLESLECRVRDLEQENDHLQFRLSHLERRV